MTITLYVEPSFVSPYVCSCVVTLTEKKLAFNVRVLDAAKGETRTPEYLARTVTGRVPALDHDGFALGESTAVVEYLEEVFPETPVLPKAVPQRARCRQLMSWLRSDDTEAIREERPATSIFYAPTKTPLSERARTAAAKLVSVSDRLIQKHQPHLFDEWCIADADLAFMLHRLIANGDDVPEHVALWATEQWKRPSVAAFVNVKRPPR
jgi:glutathione S-transferase